MPERRRIIQIGDGGITIAREARFESEARLHEAVAAHPEVLPNEDFGLGPLVPLAMELDLGGGPMDLLAADGQGRLAIVEFKRGTENPDVRQVVAQILDYGASLWRYDYEALEAKCRQLRPGFTGSLAEHVAERLAGLDEPFDTEVFRDGAESCLDSGAFVFVYCGRDLDERTRRIMTYLAEGPRMALFAVEVDYFLGATGQGAVLVPRTAFVPSWVAGPPSPVRRGSHAAREALNASPEFHEMVARMDEVAREMGLQVRSRPTGRSYLPPTLEEGVRSATSGVGVYATGRGVELNLSVLRDLGSGEVADEILARLEGIGGRSLRQSRNWPSVPCASLLEQWERARAEIIEPYFRARMEPVGRSRVNTGSPA
ncbi:MAG: hypothetical protein JOZ41_14555 [Chloroflexi bacterium]|nr:hypothetical protein [Chloroflexota bacterium]